MARIENGNGATVSPTAGVEEAAIGLHDDYPRPSPKIGVRQAPAPRATWPRCLSTPAANSDAMPSACRDTRSAAVAAEAERTATPSASADGGAAAKAYCRVAPSPPRGRTHLARPTCKRASQSPKGLKHCGKRLQVCEPLDEAHPNPRRKSQTSSQTRLRKQAAAGCADFPDLQPSATKRPTQPTGNRPLTWGLPTLPGVQSSSAAPAGFPIRRDEHRSRDAGQAAIVSTARPRSAQSTDRATEARPFRATVPESSRDGGRR